MNTLEKNVFVRELSNAVVGQILEDIESGKIPEEWDGIELRWLLEERFNRVCLSGMGGRKRKQEYNNTVLVNNL